MEATLSADKLGLILKVGFFALISFLGIVAFGLLLPLIVGYFAGSAGAVFAAALVANLLSLLVFERQSLLILGLNWHRGSSRNLLLGLFSGTIAALVVLGVPLAAGAAKLEYTPQEPGSWPAFLFVSGVLLFGAFGEELLFRGYAFQILSNGLGRLVALVLSSLLFGWVHTSNPNASALGIANTIGFGLVLGFAFFRSGDLWLPIGIHFGWNWVLAVAGAQLSGFTMGVTGYAIRWEVADLWSGGAYGPEGSILTTGIVLTLLLYLRAMPVVAQQPLLTNNGSKEV